mmetsp:Transcript_22194/g.61587  ORF Transcript_22194/g.61587 Transcript_22194/m.61587 type:complete len:235 (-) Transcript_22194:886-1590(-)
MGGGCGHRHCLLWEHVLRRPQCRPRRLHPPGLLRGRPHAGSGTSAGCYPTKPARPACLTYQTGEPGAGARATALQQRLLQLHRHMQRRLAPFRDWFLRPQPPELRFRLWRGVLPLPPAGCPPPQHPVPHPLADPLPQEAVPAPLALRLLHLQALQPVRAPYHRPMAHRPLPRQPRQLSEVWRGVLHLPGCTQAISPKSSLISPHQTATSDPCPAPDQVPWHPLQRRSPQALLRV